MPRPKNERDDASNDAAALAIVIGNEQADSGLSSKSLEAISFPDSTSECNGSKSGRFVPDVLINNVQTQLLASVIIYFGLSGLSGLYHSSSSQYTICFRNLLGRC